MLNTISKWFGNLYAEYEMITCIYMFEPWEKKFINGTILFTFALIAYSTYAYLPDYTANLLGYTVTPGVPIDKMTIAQERAFNVG